VQQPWAENRKCDWPWWIRTTINGSKVRCPAVGRRASAENVHPAEDAVNRGPPRRALCRTGLSFRGGAATRPRCKTSKSLQCITMDCSCRSAPRPGSCSEFVDWVGRAIVVPPRDPAKRDGYDITQAPSLPDPARPAGGRDAAVRRRQQWAAHPRRDRPGLGRRANRARGTDPGQPLGRQGDRRIG
jgi:hypothetical protein